MTGSDDAELRHRLWDGFARLQLLLGASAPNGIVMRQEHLVASVVPHAPDSPALNAVVALDVAHAIESVPELVRHYREHRIRRWGLWVDGSDPATTYALRDRGLHLLSAAPGMGAEIDAVVPDLARGPHEALPADLATVGHVNDLAYGNRDGRLERTLSGVGAGVLRAYRVDAYDEPAAVALALHHDTDCGVSFVATTPGQRRRGLATRVMLGALEDARELGCTTVTLQATELGTRLYASLNLRTLGPMQLWERRR